MRYHHKQPGNEDEFEDFCVRYYRQLLKKETLVRYGKRGERQDGIDIIDQLAVKPLPGIQSKHREPHKSISPAEIKAEVKKAEASQHNIDQYIIATTAKKSRNAHDTVLELNRRPNRKFTVEIHFWEDICTRLSEFARSVADSILLGEVSADESGQHGIRSERQFQSSAAEAEHDDNELFPEIIKLFKERRIEAAQYEIEQLPNPELEQGLSVNQKYAILRLKGKLALEQLNFQEASRLFLLAYDVRPEFDRAKYNRILAIEFSGKRMEAFSEAAKLVAEGDESTTLVTLYVRNATSLDEIDCHKSTIDRLAANDEEINLALAHALLGFGKVERARDAATRALRIAPESAHARMAVAMLAHNSGMQGEWKERQANLESAIQNYTEALQLAKQNKFAGLLPEILINRARIRAFLGRKDDAAHDYREAVDVSNVPSLYVRDAISYFLSTGDYSSASELAPILKDKDDESQYLRVVTKLATAKDDAEKRDCVFALAAIADTASEHSMEARFQCVQSCIEIKDFDLAKSCVPESVLQSHPFQAHTLLGWIEIEIGNEHESIAHAHKAFEESSTSAHRQEIAVLARLLSRLKDDEKALPLWEQAAIPGIVDDNCKGLIDCAQRLHRHDTIIRVCAELRETGSQDALMRRLEVRVLARYLPEKALELAKEFQSYDKRFFTAFSNLLSTRLGLIEEVHLDAVDLPTPAEIEPEESYLVIVPYIAAKHYAEAVRFLYQQLRLNFGNEHSHGQYIWLIIQFGTASRICDAPSTIDDQSAVLLQNTLTNEKRWLTIEDANPDPGRNEFSKSSPIAVALIGRSVGEEIGLPGQHIQPQQERILEIQTKYVRLYQDSISNFQHRFPGVSAIQTMHLGDPENFDPAPLIENLKQRRDHVKEVTDFYQSRLCSIYFLATRLGINELQAIKGLMWNDSWHIRCTECQPREFEERIAERLSEKITLDMSAIVTISQLDAWACLDGSKEFLVSRSTFDVISDWLSDLSPDKVNKSGHTSVDDDDRLRLEDVTPEQLESQREELEKMLEELNQRCTLKNSIALSELEPQRRELYAKGFGYHTLEAISVAKDEGAVLWTDDLFVAYLGQVDYGVPRVWTQLALKILSDSNTANSDLFHKSTARLAAWNYASTVWDARTLLSAGQISSWDTTAWPLNRCIALIRNSPTPRKDRVRIVLQFLLLLRKSDCSELRQTAVIQAALDALNDIGGARWLLDNIGCRLVST